MQIGYSVNTESTSRKDSVLLTKMFNCVYS